MCDWLAIGTDNRSTTRAPVTKTEAEAVPGARVFHYLDVAVAFCDGWWRLACADCGGHGRLFKPSGICSRCNGSGAEPVTTEASDAS